jgi:hypothetical protein
VISSFRRVLYVVCNVLGCSPAYGVYGCIHLPMKMEQTQCSKTSAIKHHTPENNPKITHDNREIVGRRPIDHRSSLQFEPFEMTGFAFWLSLSIPTSHPPNTSGCFTTNEVLSACCHLPHCIKELKRYLAVSIFMILLLYCNILGF